MRESEYELYLKYMEDCLERIDLGRTCLHFKSQWREGFNMIRRNIRYYIIARDHIFLWNQILIHLSLSAN